MVTRSVAVWPSAPVDGPWPMPLKTLLRTTKRTWILWIWQVPSTHLTLAPFRTRLPGNRTLVVE